MTDYNNTEEDIHELHDDARRVSELRAQAFALRDTFRRRAPFVNETATRNQLAEAADCLTDFINGLDDMEADLRGTAKQLIDRLPKRADRYDGSCLAPANRFPEAVD